MGRKAKSAGLKAIPENEATVPEAGPSGVDEIMRLLESIDAEGKPKLSCTSPLYSGENDDLIRVLHFLNCNSQSSEGWPPSRPPRKMP